MGNYNPPGVADISLFLWALISTLLLMEKHSLRRTLYAGGALAVVLCAALL